MPYQRSQNNSHLIPHLVLHLRIAVPTYMSRTALPGAHPDMSLPLVSPRMKEKVISGEFIDLTTLLLTKGHVLRKY